MTNCECGHSKKYHDEKEGCTFQYPPGEQHEYADRMGVCVCTQFYKV